jgi:galactokinase
MIDKGALRERFEELYQGEPKYWVRAPGRVNLIGEHTDYNDGFVLPAAIEREIRIAFSPSNDHRTVLQSLDFPKSANFDLSRFEKEDEDPWGNYVKGVAWALRKAGKEIIGFKGVAQGDVPIGSGLSSSAALEVAVALAYQAVSGFDMDGAKMAKTCQSAENGFVGVNCGIMDQFVSRLAQKNHAILIDCRTLEFRAVPLPSDSAKIVILDTSKRRGLVDSEYNARRSECEEAVRILSQDLAEVRALRDVTPEQFEALKKNLPEITCKRARHVITENERVLSAVDALKSGDLETFGQLMNESHISLRDDYQVSCAELDLIVDLSWKMPGVLGSRMTGAGFGGCAVSLVQADATEAYVQSIANEYRKKSGLTASIYVTEAAAGAEILLKGE